jgi:hypothetical protein
MPDGVGPGVILSVQTFGTAGDRSGTVEDDLVYLPKDRPYGTELGGGAAKRAAVDPAEKGAGHPG